MKSPAFTRAINCLAKYGDELTICAYPDCFSLSSTNSAKSAYCRFKYEKEFFSRYRVGKPRRREELNEMDESEDVQLAKGQLLAKNLLSILKHRTVEKSVERCELSIVEGAEADEESDGEFDSLESKLVVRFLCKHGVVKTHRLVLSIPTTLMAPGVPDTPNQARVNIGPTSLRNMLEHFPMNKGAKADPQLIWSFSNSEVHLKTCESSMNKGKGQISTELTISAEEFDAYDIYTSPIIIAFHLREFNATIAYAEAMTLSLDMCFTDTLAPLFIDIEGDCTQGLFVIATSQPPGVPIPTSQNSYRPMSSYKKRDREDTPADAHRPKRTMKIVQKVDVDSATTPTPQSRQSSRVPGSMPPPSLPGPSSFRPSPASLHQPLQPRAPQESQKQKEPLFLPSSQLSVAENRFLQEAGFGDIGTVEELHALLEDEGEEVDFSPSQAQKPSELEHNEGQNTMQVDKTPESLVFVDDMDFGPTQATQKVREFNQKQCNRY
ncbi:Cell cycle checkpoint control protein RAD9A [Leucoagaricus sp. SymC.cos]|nr:Cell cycle checkpoint control protein RAD9A [Leucoagaricus sp. SymC.cos]